MRSGNLGKLVWIIVGSGILVLLIWIMSEQNSGPFWGPALNRHSVAGSSSYFDELWSISNVFIEQGNSGSYLLTTDEAGFLIGSLDQDERYSLTSLDLLTGRIRWTVKLGLSAPTDASNNSKYTFLGFAGAGEIAAYSNKNGKRIWSQFLPGARSIDYIVPTELDLSVAATPSHFYLLDGDTGEVIKSIDYAEARPVFFENNGIRYSSESLTSFRATDSRTGVIIWEAWFDDVIAYPPVFDDNHIFLRTGEWTGRIYALDRLTGAILWHTAGNVITNVAIGDTAVYFLAAEGKLFALDAKTGSQLGTVSFEPNVLELKDPELHFRGFYVAASKDVVLLYLGDSRQLFAFSISIQEPP